MNTGRRGTPDLRSRLAGWLSPHAPITLVLVIAAVGFARVLTEHWREGTGMVGGALLVAGVARVLLPPDQAGLLAVRSRAVDILCYVSLGVLMVALATTIPRTPFILT